MSDLVQRLLDRAYSGKATDALCEEAAREIERLRAAIRRLAAQDATLSVCDGAVTVTMDDTLTIPDSRTRLSEADPSPASEEIMSLRAMLTRQSDSAHRAVALMVTYAERYGFLLGGLEMVATGHTTAERVLRSAREKYPDEN